MSSFRQTVAVFLISCALSSATTGQAHQKPAERAAQSSVGDKAELKRKIDELVSRYSAFGFSGTVLVGERGHVILQKGYGLANRAGNARNTAETVFPLASITKQFTATAIFRLESEAKLSTADPINKYLRGIPPGMSTITIAQLLTHSSGLSREADNVADAGATREEFVASVSRVPLQSTPGEKYEYSNAGYSLLAAIVEQVTGRTFESYLRTELFRAARLVHTGWRSEFDSREFARGYQEQFSGAQNEVTFPPVPSWRFLGSGSLVGTVPDLFAWNEALYNNRVLTPDARQKLFTPAFNEYVNGLWMTKTQQGVAVYMSDGDFPGYQTKVAHFPAKHTTIVLALNNDAGWATLAYKSLANILFAQPYELPPAVAAIEPAALAKLSGSYALPSNSTFNVRVVDGAMFIRADGQEAVSTLAGANRSDEELFASTNAATAELVEHLKRSDFDWLKTVSEFETPIPLERLRNFWTTMLRSKGDLNNYSIIGTTSARGGRTQTLLRFDLSNGSEYWLILWQKGKLRGWDAETAHPGESRFLPISKTDFASIDVLSGRITRVRFSARKGDLSVLSSSLRGEEIEAKRVK